ncbi:MAG TPA: TRAP transporter fused permease subunit, partial [Gammaproteobacteria bacterium]|nr:TRAP transporter fused permease subunit [Gammaproteobacteria bacterium]
MTIVSHLFAIGARRALTGPLRNALGAYAATLALWVVWTATVAIIDPLAHAAIFVSFMLALMFLVIGPTPGSRVDRPLPADYLLSAASLACGVYFVLSAETIASRISLLDPLTTTDLVFGTLIWLLTLEATRRAVGLALMLITLAFVAYNLLGHLLGGVMSHGYVGYEHFLDQSVFTTNGLFGAPVRVAATYAFLFVGFGVFFQRAGGGQFFFDLAAALTGRSPGGPAKVAIASSALYGTISGSPTSDVVTTGSITIPMMRRVGYSPVLAGAIEVAASTGGSIVPPIMGSAAFIMVEVTGIPYRTIVIAAIIPALLFYTALYAQVHLRAQRTRLGLGGLESVQPLRQTLREGGVFALPLAIIAGALVLGYTPTYVAVLGTAAAIAASLPRAERLGPRAIYEGLVETTLRVVPIVAACAAAGLVVGGISLTGLAGKFSFLVFSLSNGHLLTSLALAAGLCILLGMGMPTPSAYILAAVMIGDVLTGLDVDLLPAHMFLLFFSALSALTPPVAVAAYAASSIADANPLAIAMTALRLSAVLLILPFGFVYGPELLAQGPITTIVWGATTALAGVLALAAASEAYWRAPLTAWRRVALGAGGIALLLPGLPTDVAGAALVGVALVARQEPVA